jgi:hypothetical protein
VETERRERGRYRRREGGKETEEKNKGEETAGKRQKVFWILRARFAMPS